MTTQILATGFDTQPITMEPLWQITFQAPAVDIDRMFDAIRAITPLVHGKTDQNAFRSPGGVEYYRPGKGTPTGAEDDIRRRPGVDEIRFFLPRDPALLDRVIGEIYRIHPYYEPVITLSEILRSRTKGLDDSLNPNRWWNRGGDWKKDD